MISFLKREAVLSIAAILAVLSAFWVYPDAGYLSYVDFRTLGILFCLMAVMAGLRDMGVFSLAARGLLGRVKNLRQMILILVLLCFGFSMLITNDVALITFVPLTLILLSLVEGGRKWVVFVVVMQTIAANLGSMLTPIGNPQNLYLYGLTGMGLGQFVVLMLPWALGSLGLILVCILVKTRKAGGRIAVPGQQDVPFMDKKKLAVYILLFLLSLSVVVRLIDWRFAFAVVLLWLVLADWKVLKMVDYSLLLTFVALFIFIGNLGRIPAFRSILESVIQGREILTAVVCSQVMSNVPAALLLSGFTTELEALIVGVNLGGLGTLIASMASLISFKYISAECRENRGSYLLQFTAYNLGFLIILLTAALIF